MRHPILVPRRKFVRRLVELVHTPGLWAGRSRDGVDCSGLPILALHMESDGKLDLREGWWTDRFWRECPVTDSPLPGDFVFYGGADADDVEHMMAVLIPPQTPGFRDGLVLGAAGVTRTVTSLIEAHRVDARVKVPGLLGGRVDYRPDFRGYRSFSPFLSEEQS